MVDIQSATAENKRGKQEETTAVEFNGLLYWMAIKRHKFVNYSGF